MPHTARAPGPPRRRPEGPTAARDQLSRRRSAGRRDVPGGHRPRRAQDRAARRAAGRRRGGRRAVRPRRRRRGHAGRGVGARRGLSGQIPGGGRRAALADPPRARAVDDRPRARAGGASGGTSRSRRGPTRVEVHWARGAEAYVTPVADDCVGIAILSSTRGGFDSHFDEFPALRERVPGCHTDRTGRQVRCGRGSRAARPGGCCWSATRPATSTR